MKSKPSRKTRKTNKLESIYQGWIELIEEFQRVRSPNASTTASKLGGLSAHLTPPKKRDDQSK